MNRPTSKRLCVGFCLMLMVWLAACGASTSDSTIDAASVALTQTIALTPTHTPVPTVTPIPSILEVMPSEISDDNLSIVGGDYQFQITDVSGLKKIGEKTAPTDGLFLVLHGYLYNYSDTDREFHDVDFQIDYLTASNVNPDVALMSVLQQGSYPDARYPDCNILRCSDFILSAKKAQEIILVYTVQSAIDHLTLNFAPGGTSSRSRLGVILIEQSNPNVEEVTYLALKESVNGVLTYTVSYNEVDVTSAEVSEIIDSKVVLVDNCFGTAELSRAMEVSLTKASSFETIDEVQGKVTGLGLNLFLSGVFEGFARRMHQKMEKEELTIAYNEEVKAAPGTRTQYRLDVYKVSYSGLMVFSVGSRHFEVPYKLTDKLRTELVSEPTEPCPGLMPTVTP